MIVINDSVCSIETHTLIHVNTYIDRVVTSGAVNMELVSVCVAQGHLTALNKSLINTRPLKAPCGIVCVCVRVFLRHAL